MFETCLHLKVLAGMLKSIDLRTNKFATESTYDIRMSPKITQLEPVRMQGFPAYYVLADEFVGDGFLKVYEEFQKKLGTYEDRTSTIRGALEFSRFSEWYETDGELTPGRETHASALEDWTTGVFLKGSEQKYGSAARTCGHKLHPCRSERTPPSEGENVEGKEGYCPFCLMAMCVKLQDAIARAWQEVHLRIKRCAGDQSIIKSLTEWHHDLKKLWHLARLELSNFKEAQYEEAAYETQWEALNPTKIDLATKTYSSKKALRLAYQNMTYPESNAVPHLSTSTHHDEIRKLSISQLVDEFVVTGHKKSMGGQTPKKVSFSSDTDLEQTAENARPSYRYHRVSTDYLPGAHASFSEEGYQDTSFMTSLKCTRTQTKVFVLTPAQAQGLKLDSRPILRQKSAMRHPVIQMYSVNESDNPNQLKNTEDAWTWIEQDPYWDVLINNFLDSYPLNSVQRWIKLAYAFIVVCDSSLGISDILVAYSAEENRGKSEADLKKEYGDSRPVGVPISLKEWLNKKRF